MYRRNNTLRAPGDTTLTGVTVALVYSPDSSHYIQSDIYSVIFTVCNVSTLSESVPNTSSNEIMSLLSYFFHLNFELKGIYMFRCQYTDERIQVKAHQYCSQEYC